MHIKFPIAAFLLVFLRMRNKMMSYSVADTQISKLVENVSVSYVNAEVQQTSNKTFETSYQLLLAILISSSSDRFFIILFQGKILKKQIKTMNIHLTNIQFCFGNLFTTNQKRNKERLSW